MIRFKQNTIQNIILIVLALLLSRGCSRQSIREISTQKDVISCEYIGLSERNGQPVVELVFRNRSGENLSSVFGGLQIINQAGEVIQRTGFTYSLPFAAGEEKSIPAFAYIDIKNEALDILKSAADFVPMVFTLSEIVFEDGRSVRYD